MFGDAKGCQEHCWGYHHISYCNFIQSNEVCAPNIVSFEYHGRREIPLHNIRYVPKLEEVIYTSPLVYNELDPMHNDILLTFFGQLPDYCFSR